MLIAELSAKQPSSICLRVAIHILDDLLNQLHGAFIFFFSNIDLHNSYHQIKFRPRDEWKTTFRTIDGLYEWTLMLFTLSNDRNTFTLLVNTFTSMIS
jgi:hypothetical protein